MKKISFLLAGKFVDDCHDFILPIYSLSLCIAERTTVQ